MTDRLSLAKYLRRIAVYDSAFRRFLSGFRMELKKTELLLEFPRMVGPPKSRGSPLGSVPGEFEACTPRNFQSIEPASRTI
jgi:hypothetical protein